MSDDRFTRDPDDANANDRRAPYVDRGPRLPRVPKLKAKLVTADEIFGWLRGTFQPRMGIVDRSPKPAKPPPPAPTGPDLTQARALARECVFDEQLARRLLRFAAAINSPNHGDAIAEVCFDVAELKKRNP
jgi:hypothetical protein